MISDDSQNQAYHIRNEAKTCLGAIKRVNNKTWLSKVDVRSVEQVLINNAASAWEIVDTFIDFARKNTAFLLRNILIKQQINNFIFQAKEIIPACLPIANDILNMILNYLSPRDWYAMRRVNRSYRQLISINDIQSLPPQIWHPFDNIVPGQLTDFEIFPELKAHHNIKITTLTNGNIALVLSFTNNIFIRTLELDSKNTKDLRHTSSRQIGGVKYIDTYDSNYICIVCRINNANDLLLFVNINTDAWLEFPIAPLNINYRNLPPSNPLAIIKHSDGCLKIVAGLFNGKLIVIDPTINTIENYLWIQSDIDNDNFKPRFIIPLANYRLAVIYYSRTKNKSLCRIWNLTDGTSTATSFDMRIIFASRYGATNNLLFIVDNNKIVLWSTDENRTIHEFPHEVPSKYDNLYTTTPNGLIISHFSAPGDFVGKGSLLHILEPSSKHSVLYKCENDQLFAELIPFKDNSARIVSIRIYSADNWHNDSELHMQIRIIQIPTFRLNPPAIALT